MYGIYARAVDVSEIEHSKRMHEHGERVRFLILILLHEKFLQFDWLRAVLFQLNLKNLHVKITNLLWVVV